jgi:hypothetical protein
MSGAQFNDMCYKISKYGVCVRLDASPDYSTVSKSFFQPPAACVYILPSSRIYREELALCCGFEYVLILCRFISKFNKTETYSRSNGGGLLGWDIICVCQKHP